MKMTQRHFVLDVLRGMTVVKMILLDNQGSWSHIYDTLQHSK